MAPDWRNNNHPEGSVALENQDGTFTIINNEGVPRGFYEMDESGAWVWTYLSETTATTATTVAGSLPLPLWLFIAFAAGGGGAFLVLRKFGKGGAV
jgi:hypothetical protein